MKKRTRAGIFGAALALALAVGIAPANAWSSSHTDASPLGCWGGITGSSSYTSTTMYVSVTTAGNGCLLGEFSTSASWRTSAGGTVWGCGYTLDDFCSRTISRNSLAIGGRHVWGGVVMNT